ncbi:MAG: dTMP kinase [Myxococcota bacterium]|nr:dTMP kinase [Myxococcota bacterium]
MKRGKLIAFEGIDGSGKSTQLEVLAGVLRARGLGVVTTCEPTRGEHGQRIREMAQSGQPVAPEEELRWFVLDRREHVANVIEPALARGEWVLTDRYYLSSAAYQGARGLDPAAILADNEREFPHPDLVILVRVSPERGIERVNSRAGVAEPVFEDLEFLRRAAEIFDRFDCGYLVAVDGNGSPEAVHERVCAVVDEWAQG